MTSEGSDTPLAGGLTLFASSTQAFFSRPSSGVFLLSLETYWGVCLACGYPKCPKLHSLCCPPTPAGGIVGYLQLLLGVESVSFSRFIYVFYFDVGCAGLCSLLRARFLQLQLAGATLHCCVWASLVAERGL